MTCWSLIPLAALLPSVHYGDIVDEHRDQKDYRSSRLWYPMTFERLINLISYKLYGAWMFKDRWLDRISIILMHGISVVLVENLFGLVPAILWATSPMTLFVGLWRNGRRYTLANIIALSMVALGPWGILLYPLMRFAQVGGITAGFMYIITTNWWISLGCAIFAVLFINEFKRHYRNRSKKMPRMLYIFHRAKVIPFFKTLSFYFYRLLVPRLVFMYEDWFQSYGVDKNSTRKFFKKDGWFYGGIVCALLCLAGLWYEGTRFATWWFIIFFIPYSNIVTNHQHNNLRYAVLPGIGFYAALSAVLPWCMFIPLIAGNFICLVWSMRQFTNDIELYNFHFNHSPRSVAPYFIVGQHCVKSGDAAQAENLAKAGLKHSPNHYGLLTVLAHIGIKERDEVLKRMESLIPEQIFKRKKFLNDQLTQLKNLK